MYGSAFCLRLTLSSSFCLRRWYFLCKTSCASSFALSWVASLSHSSFILSSLRRRIPHSSLSEAASAWWNTQLRNGHHAKKTNKKTKKKPPITPGSYFAPHESCMFVKYKENTHRSHVELFHCELCRSFTEPF